MKKNIISTIFLCIIALHASAQTNNRFKLVFPHRANRYVVDTTLASENRILMKKVDSLMAVIGELEAERVQVDTTGNEFLTTNEYTPQQTDSLINLWYLRNQTIDQEEIENYDSSCSERFSSEVPDEVLIQRLADMNPYFTVPFNETVRHYMILYSEKMPHSVEHMLGLCKYYMPIFEEALARYNLPQELKYLTIVESHLIPTATSRVGARGMWQFMYKTAKGYGMRIDSYIDERLDVEIAANAAAKFLRDAYKAFGDWNLAISSYNCGAGNVNKAIRRAESREYWKVYNYLPRETRNYVPAFVGAMYAFTYYKEYGLEPEDVGIPAVADTFEIKKNLHFQQINDVVGVPMEILRQLNPQFIHDIIPGSSHVEILRLPYHWTGPFMDADQDSLYQHRFNELLGEKVLKDIRDKNEKAATEVRKTYVVRSGDTLSRIAGRYGVTVKQLQNWNHLKGTNIRIGQTLYIYKKA